MIDPVVVKIKDEKPLKITEILQTFGLTLLEGNSTAALRHQVSSARKAEGASHFRLVRAQRTGQAGDEAVVRVLAG